MKENYYNQHKEQIEKKYELKVKLEELRHRNVMDELQFMAEKGISVFDRYYGTKQKKEVSPSK